MHALRLGADFITLTLLDHSWCKLLSQNILGQNVDQSACRRRNSYQVAYMSKLQSAHYCFIQLFFFRWRYAFDWNYKGSKSPVKRTDASCLERSHHPSLTPMSVCRTLASWCSVASRACFLAARCSAFSWWVLLRVRARARLGWARGYMKQTLWNAPHVFMRVALGRPYRRGVGQARLELRPSSDLHQPQPASWFWVEGAAHQSHRRSN